jgi:hypothetical protein
VQKSVASLLAERAAARKEAKLHRAPEERPPSPRRQLEERDVLAAQLMARYRRQREDVGDLDPLLQAITRRDAPEAYANGARDRAQALSKRGEGERGDSAHRRPSSPESAPGTSRYLLSHRNPRPPDLAAHAALEETPDAETLAEPQLRPAMPQVADRQPADNTTVDVGTPLFLEVDPLIDDCEWERMDAPLHLYDKLKKVYGLLSQDYSLDTLVTPAPPAPVELLHLFNAEVTGAVPFPDHVHIDADVEEGLVAQALRLRTDTQNGITPIGGGGAAPMTSVGAGGSDDAMGGGARGAEKEGRPPAVINPALWRAAAVVAQRQNMNTDDAPADSRRPSLLLRPINEELAGGGGRPSLSNLALPSGEGPSYYDGVGQPSGGIATQTTLEQQRSSGETKVGHGGQEVGAQ